LQIRVIVHKNLFNIAIQFNIQLCKDKINIALI
jgi:hypothetical protein